MAESTGHQRGIPGGNLGAKTGVVSPIYIPPITKGKAPRQKD